MDSIELSLDEKKLRLSESNREKRESNWLTVLPIKNNGFDLNKQQFWDCVTKTQIWLCARGSKFDVQHAMNCKKGGFVIIRHNNVRDITTNMLSEVCKDVTFESVLLPVTGESFVKKSTKTSDAKRARLDIKARGLIVKGQNAFF